MKLGPQFSRLSSATGRRSSSRSEPWMTSTPPLIFHGSKAHRIKTPSASSLHTSVARSGRGRKTH